MPKKQAVYPLTLAVLIPLLLFPPHITARAENDHTEVSASPETDSVSSSDHSGEVSPEPSPGSNSTPDPEPNLDSDPAPSSTVETSTTTLNESTEPEPTEPEPTDPDSAGADDTPDSANSPPESAECPVDQDSTNPEMTPDNCVDPATTCASDSATDPDSENNNDSGDHADDATVMESAAESKPESNAFPEPGTPEGEVATATSAPDAAVPGNSYLAVVAPVDNALLQAGEEARLRATFIELSTITKLASARLYIPESLTVNKAAGVEISEDWGFSWDEPDTGSGFSAVLSIWALIDGAILDGSVNAKDQTVTATFSATPSANQEHNFVTDAWQDRAVDDVTGAGTGVGTTVNNYAAGYNEPRLNVAVSTPAGLNQVRDNLNWHYVQQADLDLTDYSDGEGWQPIGSYTQPFYGAYNGNSHTISNLTINRSTEEYVGLFAATCGQALLSDLNIEEAHVQGNKTVGILAGHQYRSAIRRVTVSGTVEAGGSYAGGLVGHNYRSAIENSHVTATVTGTTFIGGLTGESFANSLIRNSTTTGSVSGTDNVGGLVGRNRGLVKFSSSAGTVIATATVNTRAGGLVGFNDSGSQVFASFSNAAVTAAAGQSIGGLVGENAGAQISASFATGSITGNNRVGGLVGYNCTNAVVEDSYASGSVDGVNAVGGLVGVNAAQLLRTYATGTVTGTSNLGGLAGAGTGTVTASFHLNTTPANGRGTAVSQAALQTLSTFTAPAVNWSIADLADYDPDNPDAFTWYLQPGLTNPTLWWQHLPVHEEPADPSDPDEGEEPGDDEEGGGGSDDDDPGDEEPGQPGNGDDSGEDNPNGGPGNINSGTMHPFLNSSPAALNLSAPVFLVLDPAGQNTLITPGFVSEADHAALVLAMRAYLEALEAYDTIKTQLSPQNALLYQLDLSLTRAALLTLEARLNPAPHLLTAAETAYRDLLPLLEQSRPGISATQLEAALQLIAEITIVLQNLTT